MGARRGDRPQPRRRLGRRDGARLPVPGLRRRGAADAGLHGRRLPARRHRHAPPARRGLAPRPPRPGGRLAPHPRRRLALDLDEPDRGRARLPHPRTADEHVPGDVRPRGLRRRPARHHQGRRPGRAPHRDADRPGGRARRGRQRAAGGFAHHTAVGDHPAQSRQPGLPRARRDGVPDVPPGAPGPRPRPEPPARQAHPRRARRHRRPVEVPLRAPLPGGHDPARVRAAPPRRPAAAAAAAHRHAAARGRRDLRVRRPEPHEPGAAPTPGRHPRRGAPTGRTGGGTRRRDPVALSRSRRRSGR